jgi:DNA polymerase I
MSSPLDQVQLHLVDNLDEMLAFKTWVGTTHDENTLGFDTETTGLNPYGGPLEHVRLIQIGDTMQGWAFPPEWHGAPLEILRKWSGNWVAHNSRFDVNWLREKYSSSLYAPDWSKIHDTMSLAHLDDPTRSRGLKPLSGMLIDPRASSSQVVLEKELNLNNWDWRTVPIVREGTGSSYWIYAALDPVLTCRLLVHAFHDTRITYREAYELEMGTVRCIADMERRGAKVDLEYCQRMTKIISDYGRQVREWVKDAHGIANATSTMQCIARFEDLGAEITRFTKSGAKSLDKEQLQLILIDGNDEAKQLAQALLDLRRGEKFTGPYFSNFQSMADENSRVHPTIWPVGTRTARMSITSPALQTLPRKDPTVRDAFVPTTSDNVLIAIDADQIEFRLAAHFSRDEGLRHAFLNTPDVFNAIASEAFGDTITKGDPRRQTMKNGVYGKLYGAGVAKIAVTAGVPVHAMEVVMARFDQMYPGILQLQRQIESVARQRAATEGRPYVVTPTGRRMPGDPGKEYTLVNYLIQSHAAEILKRGINDLDAVGLGEYLILPVHDELVLDVPREDLDDIKQTLVNTLNAVGKDYFVPLTWGADVMQERWGDKYRR